MVLVDLNIRSGWGKNHGLFLTHVYSLRRGCGDDWCQRPLCRTIRGGGTWRDVEQDALDRQNRVSSIFKVEFDEPLTYALTELIKADDESARVASAGYRATGGPPDEGVAPVERSPRSCRKRMRECLARGGRDPPVESRLRRRGED